MLSWIFPDCRYPVQLSVCLSSMSSTMPRIINFLASLTHLAKQVKLGCSCPLTSQATNILSKLGIVPGRTPSSKASFFLPVPGDLAGHSRAQQGTAGHNRAQPDPTTLGRSETQELGPRAPPGCSIRTESLHLQGSSLPNFPGFPARRQQIRRP